MTALGQPAKSSSRVKRRRLAPSTKNRRPCSNPPAQTSAQFRSQLGSTQTQRRSNYPFQNQACRYHHRCRQKAAAAAIEAGAASSFRVCHCHSFETYLHQHKVKSTIPHPAVLFQPVRLSYDLQGMTEPTSTHHLSILPTSFLVHPRRQASSVMPAGKMLDCGSIGAAR